MIIFGNDVKFFEVFLSQNYFPKHLDKDAKRIRPQKGPGQLIFKECQFFDFKRDYFFFELKLVQMQL